MNSIVSNNDSPQPFFYAILDDVVMLEEHSKNFPLDRSGAEDGSDKVKLKITSELGFNIGVNDPSSPENLQIILEFKLDVLEDGTDKKVANYKSVHEAHYTITISQGIKDWLDLPEEIVSVYFSSLYYFAKSRAEGSLTALGLKSLSLDNHEFHKNLEKISTVSSAPQLG